MFGLSFVFKEDSTFYPGLKNKGILKHSLHVQLTSERKMINALTWVVNGGLNQSNTLG